LDFITFIPGKYLAILLYTISGVDYIFALYVSLFVSMSFTWSFRNFILRDDFRFVKEEYPNVIEVFRNTLRNSGNTSKKTTDSVYLFVFSIFR